MDRNELGIANFVRYLNSLVPAENVRGDRAALAALRRNLGRPPGSVAEAAAHVDRFLDVDPDRRLSEWDEWREQVFYALGGLFAIAVEEPFPAETAAEESDGRKGWLETAGLKLPEGNFGRSMRELAERFVKESGDKDSRQRVDRRFISLLDADHALVFEHLRHNVSLLASHDIPVNWVRLGNDLLRWNDEERSVQRRWARSYWRAEDLRRENAVPAGAGASESE